MTSDTLDVAHRELRARLLNAGLLVTTGVDGLYGHNATFEGVVSAIDRAVSELGAGERPLQLDFPPLIAHDTLGRVGYLRNFPQLGGPVCTFTGDDRDHAELLRRLDGHASYADLLTMSEVALTPACCYPIYPSLAGTLADGGAVVETRGWCFRHEPSVDPMRLQSFRMREHVRVGAPTEVLDWREHWLARVPRFFTELGLEVLTDVANDAFFGRAGRLMSASQREQRLKIEYLVPVFGPEHPTACASINYHQDHFGQLFEISLGPGSVAHSACVGFGLERCAVALFARHGLDPDQWPTEVHRRLWR
jgi:seryl-tRNA synthetase